MSEKPSLTVLAIGCGHKQAVADYGIVARDDAGAVIDADVRLITLDANAAVKPELHCLLGMDQIDLRTDSVDLVIADHVLEHIGQQGRLDEWFRAWEELYRVLKPGGRVQFICPYHTSVWAWADPSHTRAISELTFLYLNQDAYRVGGSIPDFRPHFDFVLGEWHLGADGTNADIRAKEGETTWIYGWLTARKPLRKYWT